MTTSLRIDILDAGGTMRASAGETIRRHTLNIRIQPELRGLIDQAAELAGRTRTDFVLDAARRAAENSLLDRTLFAVSPQAYRQFLKRLDAPASPNKRLRKTMQTPAPWE
jgi:uncharacterized protein (DUF1778 family)